MFFAFHCREEGRSVCATILFLFEACKVAFDELFGGGRDAYDAQRAAGVQEDRPVKRRKSKPDEQQAKATRASHAVSGLRVELTARVRFVTF